jgi:hypothetical protein
LGALQSSCELISMAGKSEVTCMCDTYEVERGIRVRGYLVAAIELEMVDHR